MAHDFHRFAATTCKRRHPSDTSMFDTSMFDTSPSCARSATENGAVAGFVRARRRRRRSGHG